MKRASRSSVKYGRRGKGWAPASLRSRKRLRKAAKRRKVVVIVTMRIATKMKRSSTLLGSISILTRRIQLGASSKSTITGAQQRTKRGKLGRKRNARSSCLSFRRSCARFRTRLIWQAKAWSERSDHSSWSVDRGLKSLSLALWTKSLSMLSSGEKTRRRSFTMERERCAVVRLRQSSTSQCHFWPCIC